MALAIPHLITPGSTSDALRLISDIRHSIIGWWMLDIRGLYTRVELAVAVATLSYCLHVIFCVCPAATTPCLLSPTVIDLHRYSEVLIHTEFLTLASPLASPTFTIQYHRQPSFVVWSHPIFCSFQSC
jgi:hypothetical protein